MISNTTEGLSLHIFVFQTWSASLLPPFTYCPLSTRQMYSGLFSARRVASQRTLLAQCKARIPPLQPLQRTLTTSVSAYYPRTPFGSTPSPPQLSTEEQREFEELVRKAQMPLAGTGATDDTLSNMHPDARKPIEPEFQGDVNPVTGERGGPKRDPLRHGDWSIGGKVTDF